MNVNGRDRVLNPGPLSRRPDKSTTTPRSDTIYSIYNSTWINIFSRERKDELPKMQVDFIDLICLPLYRVLSETFPWISPLYEGTLENRNHWQDLAEKVEMGLTWIDHDTIDKPIEGFAGEGS